MPKIHDFTLDIVPEIQQTRPNLISKHVGPLALKLLEENRAEMKPGLVKLLYSTENTSIFLKKKKV